MRSTQFDATNKKRHIFGLLAIATAIRQLGVAVKYSQSRTFRFPVLHDELDLVKQEVLDSFL